MEAQEERWFEQAAKKLSAILHWSQEMQTFGCHHHLPSYWKMVKLEVLFEYFSPEESMV